MKQAPPPSLIAPALRQEDWPHLTQLVAAGGQVIFGNMPPHVVGALATSLSGACASVLLRQGESLPQLLARLDVAVGMSDSGADERVFNEASKETGQIYFLALTKKRDRFIFWHSTITGARTENASQRLQD